jgi:hypothetical protein
MDARSSREQSRVDERSRVVDRAVLGDGGIGDLAGAGHVPLRHPQDVTVDLLLLSVGRGR